MIKVEKHTSIDKSFGVSITDGLYVKVDYDDVNQAQTDGHLKHMIEILEKNWDQTIADIYYREELIKKWNRNEYGLQEDYDSLQDYLSQHGIK